MADFFDSTENDVTDDDGDGDGVDGPCLYINGSLRPLEVGAPFLQTCKNAALSAGFGKFRVLLNGAEIRPSTAPQTVEPNHRIELRPFDEAG
jgi:hypothetical protein